MATTNKLPDPKCNKGRASIVFFYFGDSKFTTLFQETTKLKKAMDGYDKVILLKHDKIDDFLDFSEKDEKLADSVLLPTKKNLFESIINLSKEGYYLDIWIWSHGSVESFRCSNGTFGSNVSITNQDINTELAPEKTGLSILPIRMVYQINCYGSTLNNNWTSIGAKISVGTRNVNFYPTQFGNFVDEWNEGNISVASGLDKSNTATSRTIAQTYLATIHAPSHNNEWGKCPLLVTVLGDHDCSKDYFTTMWISKSDWLNGKSGKDNMNHCSTWITSGDNSINKNTIPSWSKVMAKELA